jgi:hypothetical protein
VLLAGGAGRGRVAVPVGLLARCAGRGAGPVRGVSWAGSAAWVRPGSSPRCAVSCPCQGATRPCLRIVRAVFAALADPAGVIARRPGALERVHLAMCDWRDTRERLAGAEARMTAVLDGLGLTELVTTIAG